MKSKHGENLASSTDNVTGHPLEQADAGLAWDFGGGLAVALLIWSLGTPVQSVPI